MRQSQCRVLLWRSAVVTKNLRTVPTILITFTSFKGRSRLWEDAQNMYLRLKTDDSIHLSEIKISFIVASDSRKSLLRSYYV